MRPAAEARCEGRRTDDDLYTHQGLAAPPPRGVVGRLIAALLGLAALALAIARESATDGPTTSTVIVGLGHAGVESRDVPGVHGGRARRRERRHRPRRRQPVGGRARRRQPGRARDDGGSRRRARDRRRPQLPDGDADVGRRDTVPGARRRDARRLGPDDRRRRGRRVLHGLAARQRHAPRDRARSACSTPARRLGRAEAPGSSPRRATAALSARGGSHVYATRSLDASLSGTGEIVYAAIRRRCRHT